VANAVNASEEARGADVLVIRVCLRASADVLTIECWDQAPRVPMMREATALAENGRGLAIVDDLTNGCWGCQPAIGQQGEGRLGGTAPAGAGNRLAADRLPPGAGLLVSDTDGDGPVRAG
jgi:hypothetical protein